MKRTLIKIELLLFKRCYSATTRSDVLDSLDDLDGFSVPVPWKGMAMRKAARRERRTGVEWHVSKFGPH